MTIKGSIRRRLPWAGWPPWHWQCRRSPRVPPNASVRLVGEGGDWVGGDGVYTAFRRAAVAACSQEDPSRPARKLVVVSRSSPYRQWYDEAALHRALRRFGLASTEKASEETAGGRVGGAPGPEGAVRRLYNSFVFRARASL